MITTSRDKGWLSVQIRLDGLLTVSAVLFIAIFLFDQSVGGQRIPFVRPILALIVFLFGPGALALSLLEIQPQFRTTWLAYALGVGAFLLMTVGLVVGILPVVGSEQPLATRTLSTYLLALLATLLAGVYYRGGPLTFGLSAPTSLDTLSVQPMSLLLVPLWAILSVELLNGTGMNIPLITVLSGIPVLVIAVSLSYLDDRNLTLAVWCIALALLYHKSLWSGFTYGGHASVVTSYETMTFALSRENLLQNAILMPALARLAGIGILTQMKVVMPFLVSFIPISIFTSFRRYTTPRTAFLGAIVFVFAHPFYYQYPSTPRASIPVLFFVLIGLTMSDSELSIFQRRLVGYLFALSLAVSHYGTAYYVMFAIIGSLVLLLGRDVINAGLHRFRHTERSVPDGGHLNSVTSSLRSLGRDSSVFQKWGGLLTPPFIATYVATVLGWYLFTGGGKKFTTLAEHLINAYRDVFVSPSGQGSTATRLAVDYGAESIALSKYLYILLAFLTGVGLIVVYIRRFFDPEYAEFDDGYLVLATLVLFLFGGTFVLSGEWGGGRPMMIVLAFDAVFVVVAVITLGDVVRGSILQIERWLDRTAPTVLRDVPVIRRRQRAALAIILAIFLLLNSGVMAALVLGGYAPSNVPIAGDTTKEDYPPYRVGEFVETDLQAHAWMADHMNRQLQIYTDKAVYQQATDWYNGEIAARATRDPYRFKPKYNLENLADSSPDRGYVLFGGHNVISNIVTVTHVKKRPLSSYNLGIQRRNKIYTSGRATAYFGNETWTTD